MPPIAYRLPLTAPPHVLAMHPGNPHGGRGDETYLSNFWVINLVLGGRGSLQIGEATVPFSHGTVLVIPAGVAHRYRFTRPVTKVWVHFQPIVGAQAVTVPLIHDLGDNLPCFRGDMIDVATRFVHEPERGVARVWDLLWRLAPGIVEGRAERSPLAERLLRHLELRLVDPVDPAELAQRFRVSATHLNRLCHQATGLPLVAFVRRRRLELAVHLLHDSTQSIAQIAAQVGYPDLSHFNKLVRAFTGRSPRAVREASPLVR